LLWILANFENPPPNNPFMKTVQLVLRSAMAVCFAFVMSSASCDLFDKVDDVSFDIELSHTFNVDETVIGGSKTYSKVEILDAAKLNSDFNKYKDKIKSITVTGVTYEVSNYTTAKSVIFTNGKIGFSSSTGTSASSVASLGVEDVKAAVGQVKNLAYNQAALDEISTTIKNDKKANIYLNGTFSETPVKFDVKVIVKATLVADAL
jgi:hypothetical protein